MHSEKNISIEAKNCQSYTFFKNGCANNATNYRPISIFSPISKIFEKIIYNRLNNYFTTHNIIAKEQFGFRTKHSSNHVIFDVINKVQNLHNNKCITFKKSYDLPLDLLQYRKERIAQNIYIHNSNRNYKKLTTTTILIKNRIGMGYKNYGKQCPGLELRLIPKLINWTGLKPKKQFLKIPLG